MGPKTVNVGDIYQDMDGERRGRAISRYVEVRRLIQSPTNCFQTLAIIKNTKTLRETKVAIERLMTPRYSLVTEAAKTPAQTPA